MSFSKIIVNSHVFIHEIVVHIAPGTVLKSSEKKSTWPALLGTITSAGVQRTSRTSPHECQAKPSGLRTGKQVTKTSALLDPGGKRHLSWSICYARYTEVRNRMRRKDSLWASVCRRHSLTTGHRRSDSEQARQLASWPASLAAVTPQKAPGRMVGAGRRQEEQWYGTHEQKNWKGLCILEEDTPRPWWYPYLLQGSASAPTGGL